MLCFLKSLFPLILPGYCPLCGKKIMGPDAYICDPCFHNINDGDALCPLKSGRLKHILCCRPYHGVIKKCIHQFKYCGKKYIIDQLEIMIKTQISNNRHLLDFIDFIIPVPISYKRRLRRGFNQSELIARSIHNCLPGTEYAEILKKTRDTPQQIGLPRKMRLDNLRGSFTVAGNRRIKGCSVLLVDDVYTTGATLEACANELLDSGVKEVSGFTLARTL